MAKGYGFERDLYGGGDGAADVIRGTVAAWLWAAEQAGRVQDFAVEYLTDAALRLGLERLGVTIPEGEPVTAETIGRALGAVVSEAVGFDVGNLLDAEQVRASMKRAAVAQVADRLGLQGVTSADGIAAALAGEVRGYVAEAVKSGGGDLLDAVPVSEWQLELARRGAVRTVEPSTRPDAAVNRERQRRWRDSNRRVKV